MNIFQNQPPRSWQPLRQSPAFFPRRFAIAMASVLIGALAFAPGDAWRSSPISGALLAQTPAAKKSEQPVARKTGSAAAQSPLERLVRIRAVVNIYHPLKPYAAPEIQEWIGSGIWLGDGQILTDLRLVRFASVIEYWKPGSDPAQSRSTPALLLHRGHDCGLAVIGDREGNASPKLPAAALSIFSSQAATVGQELRVFGFAASGADARSAYRARGILVRAFDPVGAIAGSDIDRHALYRIDFRGGDPEPGRAYSGGPAIAGERGFVGVYMRGEGEIKGYVLAAATVRAFLADVAKDGRYDGFPRTGLHFESVASGAARRYLGLESAKLKNGVLVRRVDFQSAAWSKVRPGDVLLQANGRTVDFAGRIAPAGKPQKESVDFNSWLRTLAGAPLKLKLLRKGDPAAAYETTLNLKARGPRHPGPGRSRLLDQSPYFMGGGLVFQELEYDLVHASDARGQSSGLRDEAEVLHRYYNYYTDRLGEQVERDVILTARLPDPVNADADRFVNGIVRSVNGRRIRNLKDFAAEWGYTRQAYIVVEFLNRPGPLVVDFEASQKAEERIRTRYRVQENGRVL